MRGVWDGTKDLHPSKALLQQPERSVSRRASVLAGFVKLKMELRRIPLPLTLLEMFLQLHWSPTVGDAVVGYDLETSMK